MKNKISTTQIASFLGLVAVIYNAYARTSDKPVLALTNEELLAIATLSFPAISFVYMSIARIKRGDLKWGIFK